MQTCQSTVRINIIPVVAPSVPSTGSGSTTGFTQTSFTFTASNCAAGATVGQVGSGTTTGGAFTYSLTSPNTYFSISSTTGIITLLQIPPAGTYSLTATSISSSGLTTSVPVSITTTCNGFGTGTLMLDEHAGHSALLNKKTCILDKKLILLTLI